MQGSCLLFLATFKIWKMFNSKLETQPLTDSPWIAEPQVHKNKI